MTYSNPRRAATIEDWPSGSRRVTAKFEIESKPKRGERVARTTTGKPKKSTYYDRCVIVDGSDGKTYFLGWSRAYRMICIMRGDMKFCEETIHGEDARYAEFLGFFTPDSLVEAKAPAAI